MQLLLSFILAIFGGSTIICFSNIFKPIRDYLIKINPKFLGKLITCFLCTGFWLGFILSCLGLAPFTNLSPYYVFITQILDGFCGAGVSWLFYCVLKDKMFD
jgi:hypothetical protein